MLKLLKKWIRRRRIMMINYFAMQIEFGWITLEDVPKKYREKVKQLVESGNIRAE